MTDPRNPAEARRDGPLEAYAAHDVLPVAEEFLLELIGISSPSGDEAAVIDAIERRCGSMGLPTRRIPVPEGGDDLLIGWAAEPTLLLTAHADTIHPTWDPPQPQASGSTVRGLGAVDDKGSAVACILALLLAQRRGVDLGKVQVAVGITVDEERYGTGSAALAEAVRAPYVVAAEGTELSIAVEEAGYVEAWVRIQGRSVHGSLIEEGDNAAMRAARFALALEDLPSLRAPATLVGRALPSIEEWRAGGPVYAVPGEAELRVDIRTVPGIHSDEVLKELEDMARLHGGSVDPIATAEPFRTEPGTRLPTALRRAAGKVLGREPAFVGMPSWTDAHNFVERGSHAVIFGPGSLRAAHRPDEQIDLREVVAAAEIMAELIEAGGWTTDRIGGGKAS